MAYQARRKEIYREEFQLVDENGTIAKRIFVELDPDSMAKKLSEKYVALIKVQRELQNVTEGTAPEEQLCLAGNAVTDLFEAVFGKDDAQIIVEFFRGRYIEMCREVLPFIEQEVIPAVRKMAKENKAAIASGYNRKQRRHLFGKK